MGRIIEIIKNKKRLALGIVVACIIISFWLVPSIITRVGLSKLKVEDVSKIVYVQYEDMPLSSEVKSKRVITVADNKAGVQDFLKLFQDSDVILRQSNKKTSDMIFLYFVDDSVVNAYVVGDILGFQYGKYWVDMKDIDGFIMQMIPLENIEVKPKTLNNE